MADTGGPEPTPTLESLLTYVKQEDYDDRAVRALIERNPGAVRDCNKNYFHLHSALRRGASYETIRLLCEGCPEAVLEENGSGETLLHCACGYGATFEVVSLLYERWPEAIAAEDEDGRTVLHTACGREFSDDSDAETSLEVVKFLVSKYPQSLTKKDSHGKAPLAWAFCWRAASFDNLFMFLIEKNPDAVKEKDNDGCFPLHAACYNGSSSKVVTMLVDRYPKAIESKTTSSHFTWGEWGVSTGNTPLHAACISGASIEVVKLLIERFPKAVQMENDRNQTPLQCAEEPADDKCPSPEVVDLLTTLSFLQHGSYVSDNDPRILAALQHFRDMNWPGGVALVLDEFPSVVNTIDHGLFPTILSLVGRRGALSTFYAILQDNPTLLKGAVKSENRRTEQPPTKKARK